MRLVIHRNIAQRIEEEVRDAHQEGLTVERVEVTREEMAELAKCPQNPGHEDPLGQRFCVKDGEVFVLGVPVVLQGSVKRPERIVAA